MEFLADENIPLLSIRRLTDAGHDVVRIIRSPRKIPDVELLDRATELRRTIITFDSDFGRLVFAEGRIAPYGVVYLRLENHSRLEPADRMLELLLLDNDPFTGYFTTVDD